MQNQAPNTHPQEEGLLKLARDAFERASTMHKDERLEVYLDNDEPKISNVLDDKESIVYSTNKILCYQIYGYDYLEDEIKTWIDYARTAVKNKAEDAPEPTPLESSIFELAEEIAKNSGRTEEEISSYEVFANMPMNLLGTIEQEILEYWWNAKESENAKKLAQEQIREALK
jgi:hypothetical protein